MPIDLGDGGHRRVHHFESRIARDSASVNGLEIDRIDPSAWQLRLGRQVGCRQDRQVDLLLMRTQEHRGRVCLPIHDGLVINSIGAVVGGEDEGLTDAQTRTPPGFAVPDIAEQHKTVGFHC
jgi:hypothetical protein